MGESKRVRERQVKLKDNTTPWIQRHLVGSSFWSSQCWGPPSCSSGVSPLYSPSSGYPWGVDTVPITWEGMCISSCFLFPSLPQWEFLSRCINQDAPQIFLHRPGIGAFLLKIPLSVLISSSHCSGLSHSVALAVFKAIVIFKSLTPICTGTDWAGDH